MHLGVDATCWSNARGYGRHARGLLSQLVRLNPGRRYTFVTDAADAVRTMPAGVETRLVTASSPTTVAASATGRRSIVDMLRMGRALSSGDFDVLFFPTIYSVVPILSRARKVVTIHDAIPEAFPELTLPRRQARLLWKAKVALGCRQADTIVTVSEYSRRMISRYLGLDPGRIFVVGEAGDPIFRPLANARLTPGLAAAGICPERRLIVYLGGCNPHKNLEMLLAVVARLAGRGAYDDLHLVMVGDYAGDVFHGYLATIRRQIERDGLGDRVIFPGFLPDEELVVLLNLASVLVLPSLMEGYGLPAVEAAACGCPVIATRESPLPELLGDGGIFVDPRAPDELERALEAVLGSEARRREMGVAGVEAARRLSWDAAARQLDDLLRQVAR